VQRKTTNSDFRCLHGQVEGAEGRNISKLRIVKVSIQTNGVFYF